MSMRKVDFFISRFFALFLLVSLCLPGPAFALRNLNIEENRIGLEELQNRLQEGQAPKGVTGLEESTARLRQLTARLKKAEAELKKIEAEAEGPFVKYGPNEVASAHGQKLAAAIEDFQRLERKVAAARARQRSISTGLEELTVLVVEDQQTNRDMLGAYIQAWRPGTKVIFAKNMGEARDALHTSPNIIVTDGDYPGGSGEQLVREVQGDPATRHIPMVFVTGEVSKRKAALDGFKADGSIVGYAEKPVRLVRFRELMDAAERARILSVQEFLDAHEALFGKQGITLSDEDRKLFSGARFVTRIYEDAAVERQGIITFYTHPDRVGLLQDQLDQVSFPGASLFAAPLPLSGEVAPGNMVVVEQGKALPEGLDVSKVPTIRLRNFDQELSGLTSAFLFDVATNPSLRGAVIIGVLTYRDEAGRAVHALFA